MSNTKIWAISIIGLICVWFVYIASSSLKPAVWAIVLAFIIHPLVLWIQKRMKLKQKPIAVAIAIVLILALLIILINSFLPSIIEQMMSFAREFTGYSQRFMRAMDGFRAYLDGLGLDNRIISQVDDAISQLFTVLSNFIWTVVSLLLGYLFRLTDIVIITILLFYFLIDGPGMVSYLLNCMPPLLQEPAKNFVDGIDGIVWGYMKNQVIVSILTGVVLGVAFFFLRLPFPGLLWIISAVMNMIPYFGSIVNGVVMIFISMVYLSSNGVIATFITILAVNIIFGNIVTPMLQGRTMRIHPAGVITALVVCNYLWGAVGMLIAVPLMGLIRLLFRETMNVVRKL